MESPNQSFKKYIDVLVLCGGLGTRFREVMNDRPKALAPIGNKTFLDILVNKLLENGFKRIIFCVGHLKEQIISYYSGQKKGISYFFSQEQTPLGTGGAVKNAEKYIEAETLLILNGDSFCDINLSQFCEYHFQRGSKLSMVLCHSTDSAEYGNVTIDEQGNLLSFYEKKTKTESGLINAGIYLMHRKWLSLMPPTCHFSLEYDFFPKILKTQKCLGFVVENKLWDIGNPARYKLFTQNYEKL